MKTQTIILALGATLAGAPAASAQKIPPDSMAGLVNAVRTGSIMRKADAVGELARVPVDQLGPEARAALVNEMARINNLLVNGIDDAGLDSLGDEGLDEYHLDLTVTIYNFNDPVATRVLIPAVGVSSGIERRVARLGDVAVPPLLDLIRRGYAPAADLETLGLAWFWADSTGAALSDDSRRQILGALLAAGASDGFPIRDGAATALGYAGDPAFVPLAAAWAQRPVTGSLRMVAFTLNRRVLPRLSRAANALPPLALAERTQRVVALVCGQPQPSARLGACQALQEELREATQQLAAQRITAARNGFDAVAKRAAAAFAQGALSADEVALIGGGARQVLARLQ